MQVYSIFPSIDGEVSRYHQGRLTTFIRMAGCNLGGLSNTKPCLYCDTLYALSPKSGTEMSVKDVMNRIEEIGIFKITITGGEPMLQVEEVYELTKALYFAKQDYTISVETNGTLPCIGYNVGSWVVDYKLASSGVTDQMDAANFLELTAGDFVKFVIEDRKDFDEAVNFKNWLQQDMDSKVNFAFSPCHGKLNPNDLISWLMDDRVMDAVVNFQLHKVLDIKELD